MLQRRLGHRVAFVLVCLHGEAGALKQPHSGHAVNGAAIHTQLTAAACDGQPVAPGGSSLGAKMGLLSGDRDEGRRTHGAPTRTPSPMKALVGAGASTRCLNVQPVHRTASPSSSDARVAATSNLLSTRHCRICDADAGEPQCPSVPVCQTELSLEGSTACLEECLDACPFHARRGLHPCQAQTSPVPRCMEIWNPRQISGEAFVHMWKVSRMAVLHHQAKLHNMNCCAL